MERLSIVEFEGLLRGAAEYDVLIADLLLPYVLERGYVSIADFAQCLADPGMPRRQYEMNFLSAFQGCENSTRERIRVLHDTDHVYFVSETYEEELKFAVCFLRWRVFDAANSTLYSVGDAADTEIEVGGVRLHRGNWMCLRVV
ncbi:unnamed protein product [Amoebophrya sp. A25]|nr:unnamed protein product [Amoebophrya sp. A25]|eukprot:GSA25T00018769001.1